MSTAVAKGPGDRALSACSDGAAGRRRCTGERITPRRGREPTERGACESHTAGSFATFARARARARRARARRKTRYRLSVIGNRLGIYGLCPHTRVACGHASGKGLEAAVDSFPWEARERTTRPLSDSPWLPSARRARTTACRRRVSTAGATRPCRESSLLDRCWSPRLGARKASGPTPMMWTASARMRSSSASPSSSAAVRRA